MSGAGVRSTEASAPLAGWVAAHLSWISDALFGLRLGLPTPWSSYALVLLRPGLLRSGLHSDFGF